MLQWIESGGGLNAGSSEDYFRDWGDVTANQVAPFRCTGGGNTGDLQLESLKGRRCVWMNSARLILSVSYWSAHFPSAEREHKTTLTNQRLAASPVVVERSSVIRPWRNLRYIAHSYRVPPDVLNEALGLPPEPDRRPIREIARDQNRSVEEVIAILEEAIVHSRPPYPPPSPRPRDRGRSP